MRMAATALFCSTFLVIAGPAGAATHLVNPEGSGLYSDIQSAIDACAVGDTVQLAPGTYRGGGNLDLNFNGIDLVLRGSSDPASTVIDGEWSTDTEHGMHFESGESPAAIVEGVTFFQCYAYGQPGGGGVFCEGASSPTLKNLIFRECAASWTWNDSPGAGLYCLDSSPLVEDLLFLDCKTIGFEFKGAMAIEGESDPILRRVRFQANEVGGLKIYSGAHPVLDDLLFEQNWTGGLSIVSPDSLVVSGLEIRESQGPGMVVSGGHLTVRDCLFYRNQGIYWHEGGAIVAWGGELFLEGVTLAYNESFEHYAAAIHLDDMVSATFDRVLVTHSSGQEAIHWTGDGAAPTFTCCNVWGNEGGDYSDSIGDQTGLNGNISEKPIYCGIVNAPPFQFSVSENSPCLPENNDCGELIGAFGQGCGATGAGDLTPGALTLHAHPNPFNPRTTLEFTMEEPARLRLSIHDIAGRELEVLAAGLFDRGIHSVEWKAGDLPSGVYMARLESDVGLRTRKLVLLR